MLRTWIHKLKSGSGPVGRTLKWVAGLRGSAPIPAPPSDGTAERAGADLMHFTTQNGFITNLPSIYHPHDLQHLHLPELFEARERVRRESLYRACCERSTLVAVASSWVKRDVVEHYQVPEDRVQVVPWAPLLEVYPEPSPGDLARIRGSFKLPEAFVLYPAQTWPHKNHLGLLKALSLLRGRDGLVAPLVCSGRKNAFFPVLEKEIHGLGLADQVQFLGFVQPIELQCLYRLSRCVVLPTRFEAASLPLWEAFAAGAPTACSNVTSLPRQAGDSALLFDPGDPAEMAGAIRRLWTDEPLRTRLRESGLQNVRRFTWKRTARHFRAHYRKIAGRLLTEEDREVLAAAPLL